MTQAVQKDIGAGSDEKAALPAAHRRPRGAFARMAVAALIVVSTVTPAAPPAPVAGVDYAVLVNPVHAEQGPGIEVVEVFSYACAACAKFDPALDAWRRKMPRDVRLHYVPAVFGGAFDAAAKAYYTAAQLGVVDETHTGIYRAVHVEQTLTGDSLDQLSDAYARLGVDRARFRAVYQTPKIEERLRWAKAYAMSAGIDTTPSLIVAGKYRVAPKRGALPEQMLATVDYLIDVERRARTKR